jgi:hypothetical protein
MKRFVRALATAFVVSVVAAGIDAANASDKQTLDPAPDTAQNGSNVSAPNASPKEAKGSTTTKVNVDDQGIILKGYDVVAYFKKGILQLRAPTKAPHTFSVLQRIRLILITIAQNTSRSTALSVPTG